MHRVRKKCSGVSLQAEKWGKGMLDVFCYALEGRKCIFADERNKKHLLDCVLNMHENQNWPVYGFCVTDDAAYIITAGAESELSQEAEKFIQLFYNVYEGRSGEDCALRIQVQAICSVNELVEQCVELHRLPIIDGYVKNPGDYWWSSYRTYVGGYVWPMVNCSIILQALSMDEQKAQNKFRAMHRKGTQKSFLMRRAISIPEDNNAEK